MFYSWTIFVDFVAQPTHELNNQLVYVSAHCWYVAASVNTTQSLYFKICFHSRYPRINMSYGQSTIPGITVLFPLELKIVRPFCLDITL